MKSIVINPKILAFDNKVIEMCKSCKRYDFKATCPPHTESVEYYEKLLRQYKHGVIWYDTFECADLADWKIVGKESSLAIHHHLLKEREMLFADGHFLIALFGAGSCKLCPKDCAFPCRQPQNAIVPLEATGVNVVKLMKQYNVDVTFPVKNNIYRIGLVLYD
jgi:predicted metal-binding protein